MGWDIDPLWALVVIILLLGVGLIIWFSVTKEDRDKKRMYSTPKGSTKNRPRNK
jgi:nitric oxide reductase large subunit